MFWSLTLPMYVEEGQSTKHFGVDGTWLSTQLKVKFIVDADILLTKNAVN